ncbi:guanylate kinase [Desulfosoma caldarium]|uniref:Guanylate kinase n=1 Tax=Desulfosoma caldarium TaxID=610254 RepID=A0A3N1VL71_9BACT|nr:guanylate kinase [Desulfosoma caldarium]ROR01758.1 guanylate kinase [Desulfosoma caldarium]
MAPDLRGHVFILSAPSGVGKSTIVKAVLAQDRRLRFSVSCTTRPPRPGEIHGVDYDFLSHQAFEKGIEEGRFLEWAKVYGNYYGTDRHRVQAWLAQGLDVLLEIDVQGARKVRATVPESTTLFILPPSMDALAERLRRRATDAEEVIRRRLKAAQEEIREAPWYDYIIVNDVLEEAVADVVAIIRASRCARLRAHGVLAPFLAFF